MPALRDTLRLAMARLAVPLLLSAVILLIFYVSDQGGAFGYAALDSTARALNKVLGAIGFLSLAVLLNRFIRYVMFESVIPGTLGVQVPKLLSQIASLAIFMVATSACAGIVFGQDLTVLWAASGVAGLVLGMALRELLQDVFAGIALNIDRATRIGDFIQVHRAGDERTIGQLVEISWRTTRMKDLLGDVVSFPNSKFSAYTITNFSQPEAASTRRVSVLLDSRVPPERAKRILQGAACEALENLVGPQAALPAVAVQSIRLEGVEYIISFRAEWHHLIPATRRILETVLSHLARAGLHPAGPSMQLNRPMDLSGRPQARPALFAGLDDAGYHLLEAAMTERRLAAGQVLVQAGEVGGSLYIVTEGLLTAEAAGSARKRDVARRLVAPGELLGSRVVLLGEAHRQTVTARTDAVVQAIPLAAVQRLLAEDPAALGQLAQNLASQDEAGAHPETVAAQLRQIFPGSGRGANRIPRV